ncbi:MAG: HlyD family type I secretion periplasmic adaptor subunit [Cyanobacteria bacterium]|jgi:HlyD family secretion protein|nr:HlyD family type I secretion periplasmic adaptor subunit [Cyanobacteria bacterium GSL.Bin1]
MSSENSSSAMEKYQSQTDSQKTELTNKNDHKTNSSALSTTTHTSSLEQPSEEWSSSVQNLLDKPPASFPLRSIFGSLVFCIAIASWAWFGHIDKVGQAQGKLIPKGDTYQIEPTRNGKIKKLLIEEGDTVKKGETLAKLNAEKITQNINQLNEKLANHENQLQQKENLLETKKSELLNSKKIATTEIESKKIAIAQTKEKISAKTRQLQAIQLEVSQNQKRVKRLKPLQQNGAISQEYLFQAQQSLQRSRMKLIRIQNEVKTAQQEIKRLQVNLSQAKDKKKQLQLEAQQKIQQLQISINQLKGKIENTKHELAITKNKQKETLLKSPINGTVLSLNLQNIGQVIKPGQTIAELAPQNNPLVLDAAVPAQEAGFLEKGMSVKIKFNAYPYQDYGVIEGNVLSISPNSHTNKKGTFYQVEIGLDRNYIKHNQEKIKFKAGQSANAEIIIRRRRIANVIFDPIKKLQEGGLNL